MSANLFATPNLIRVTLILLGAIAAAVGTANAQPAGRLRIVAATTLIAEVVADIGGDAVEIATLIPPASCPGHFDVKPGDMQLLAEARLFFLHSWQSRTFSAGIIRASGNPALRKAVLEVPGNWMTPPVQVAATERIAAVLAEADPARAGDYRSAAERRKVEIQKIGAAQAQRLAQTGVRDLRVLANEVQADFVRWAGLQVVGAFGRGEDMSPREVEDAVRLGREHAVRLVVDNLQSGRQAGIGIAKEIGAVQVTLSNFPGGFENTETWEKAIVKNVDLLIAAKGG
jgi:ABC-type Zn uptake system ZnuABC Zn-binding protein ZnuA